MRQVAITFTLDGLDPEAAENACFEAGALALSYTDQRDDAILEPAPGEFRLWPATRLQALFPADHVDAAFLVTLAAAIGCDTARLQLAAVQERAWEREWLRDFVPLRFGRNLWICPSHHEIDEPGAKIVKLDPGLAFGTGTHPTTRLCLEHLDAYPPGNSCVVDFGCGSGVLAIAALALGAREALAHDIDPQALIATHDNAARNGVDAQLTTFEDADQLEARAAGRADLVLANILSGPLCELAPRLVRLLRPGGEIVLAGLLAEQEPEVVAAYAPWLALQRVGERDGWVCLAGRTAANLVGTDVTDPLESLRHADARPAPRAARALALALGTALVLQIAHRERAAFKELPAIGPVIDQLYSAMGRPIEPNWAVRAYEARQLGAATDERPGFFTVRAQLRNVATHPQPAPLLRLKLLDRDGRTVAQRDLLPHEYATTNVRTLASGARVDAELSAADPGPKVAGFEIDACLPRADRPPVCANDVANVR